MTKNETPLIENVVAYFNQCGIKDAKIAELWYHDHNAIGWMEGKYKITNWQSAASAYILRMIESSPDVIISTGGRKLLNIDEDLKKYNEGK